MSNFSCHLCESLATTFKTLDQHLTCGHLKISHSLDIIPQMDGMLSDSVISNETNCSSSPLSSPSSTVIPVYENSWFSQSDNSILEEAFSIPVIVNNRPSSSLPLRMNRKTWKSYNNITIKSDNKHVEALSLPTFSALSLI